jgi:tetratricopeptide (TPR) repeat protein
MAQKAYEGQYEAQPKWLAWHEIEQDNIFKALDWAEGKPTEQFAELAGLVGWYWMQRSVVITGITHLEKAMSRSNKDSAVYARAAFVFGKLNWFTGGIDFGLKHMHEGVEVWKELGNSRETAATLAEISEPMLHAGDYNNAIKYAEEGLGLAKEIGNQGLINNCLSYLCTILVHTKQYEKGRPLVEELLQSSLQLEQLYMIEAAYHLLGDCTVGMKDYKQGEKQYAKGIEVSFRQGNIMFAATDIQGVAFAVSGQRRWAKAIRLDAAARKKYKELGVVIDGMLEFWDEWITTYIEGAKKEVGETLAQKYHEEGWEMSFDEAVKYALDFERD